MGADASVGLADEAGVVAAEPTKHEISARMLGLVEEQDDPAWCSLSRIVSG